METTPAFDVNVAIRAWRDGLGQSPAIRRENLDDLESHLRESVARLEAGGLSAEEAFMVACKRIGTGSALSAEFAKINARALWLDRVLWMLVGVQVFEVATASFGLVALSLVYFGLNRFARNFSVQHQVIAALFVTLANVIGLAGSLGVAWWLLRRGGPSLGARLGQLLQRRRPLIVLSLGLCLIPLVAYVLSMYVQFALFPNSYLQNRSISLASVVFAVIQTTTLVGLTVFVGRERFRMQDA